MLPETSGKLKFCFIIFLSISFAIAGYAGIALAQSAGTNKTSPTGKKNKIEKMLQNEVTLSAVLGIDNKYFEDHLTPLEICLNNGRESNFEGEIVVRIGRNPYRIVNVVAGPQSIKKFNLSVKTGRYASPVKISLIDSKLNKTIYEDNVTVLSNTGSNYYILSVSENTSFYNEIRNQQIMKKVNYLKKKSYDESDSSDGGVEIVSIKPDELFRYSECYAPYSMIILNSADISTLTKVQEQALINYVNEGGSLLVSYGGFASRIASSGLASILPVKITGSEMVDGVSFYRAAGLKTSKDESLANYESISVPLTVGEPADDASIPLNYQSGEKSFPLIAHKRFGRGISYFTAFDISQTDLSKIRYLKDNIKWLMISSNNNEAMNVGLIAEYINDFMASYMKNEARAPEPYGSIAILSLFAAFVCFGVYFLAKRNLSLGRILIVTIGASWLAFVSMGYSELESVMNQATVYELGFHMIDNSNSRVRTITALSILEPPLSKAKYVIDSNTTSFYNQNNSYDSNDDDIYVDDDFYNLINPRMGFSYSKYVLSKSVPLNGKFSLNFSESSVQAEEQENAGPSINSQANPEELIKEFKKKFKKKKNTGPGSRGIQELTSITNNTDLEIEEACIFYEDHYYETGKLAPGSKVDLTSHKEVSPRNKMAAFIEDVMNRLAHPEGSFEDSRPAGSKIINPYGNSNFRNRDFLDQVGSRALMQRNIPTLVGYIRNAPAFSAAHSFSQCNRRDAGSIILVKLK